LKQPENEQFTVYLSQLQSHLRCVPQDTQSRSLEEARQHLQTVYEQLVADGWSNLDAVPEAVRRFGKASEIGKQLTREWCLTRLARDRSWSRQSLRSLTIRNDRQALLYAYAMFGVCLALFSVMAMLASTSLIISNAGTRQWMLSMSILKTAAAVYLGGICPFVSGWLVGLKSPERALMAVSHMVLFFALLGFASGTVPLIVEGGDAGSEIAQWASVTGLWLAVACLGAYLSACWKGRSFYAPSLGEFRYRRSEVNDGGSEASPTTA